MELHNPLQIALQLTSVYLLWSFTPSNNREVIRNDDDMAQDGSLDEIIRTDVLKEVLLEPEQTQKVQLQVCPLQQGELHVEGLAYSLGLSEAQREAAAPLGPLPSPVQGYQQLTLPTRGSLAHPSKGARPDLRLHPTIVGPMPLLTVSPCLALHSSGSPLVLMSVLGFGNLDLLSISEDITKCSISGRTTKRIQISRCRMS